MLYEKSPGLGIDLLVSTYSTRRGNASANSFPDTFLDVFPGEY